MSEVAAADSVKKEGAPYFEGERVYIEAHYCGGPDADGLYYVRPLGKENVFTVPLSSISPVDHAAIENRPTKHAKEVDKVRKDWERLVYTSAVARFVEQTAMYEGLSDNFKMRMISLELFKQLKITQGAHLESLMHAPVNFKRPGMPSTFPEIQAGFVGPFRVEPTEFSATQYYYLFDSKDFFYAQFSERGIAEKVCEILNFILGIKAVRDLND